VFKIRVPIFTLKARHGRQFPDSRSFRPEAVAGIELGHAEAGVRKANRKDVLVMKLAETATVAGVFT
jgi:hypothetical protein